MIKVRKSSERGHANHGWLDTYHTFSFNTYYDPNFMGFRSLRVINEDYVAAGQGFGTHGHKDMEILTCVVAGELAHKDSMGNVETIKPHEWQRMSAGTGVRHSEFNHSEADSVHLLQIWIEPERANIKPSYEQKTFAPEVKNGRLKLVASPDGADDSLTIHQNVRLFDGILKAGETIEQPLANNRHAWLQIIKGAVDVNGEKLTAGDGAAVSGENLLKIKADKTSEILLFDLA